ncbi:hypothetical protein BKA81DRAFT_405909 [Phyllosticta paracitricarpa]|uniref:Mid2 domain-containing protein n=1 Tax=Phyllosticta paracitricarpa TaxID=2016321 RepID=A0ABR1NK05_9PEZI
MTISTNGTCWYPDGTLSEDVPCNSTAAAAGEATACCGSAALCMANGLCLDWGVTSRGSCTDKSWTEGGGCTQYCVNDDTSGGSPLRVCTIAIDPSDSTFACGATLSNCDQGVNTFTLTSNTVMVARPTQLARLASAVGAEVVVTTGAASSAVSGVCTLAVSAASSSASSATGVASASGGDASASGNGLQGKSATDGYSSGEMAGVGVGVGAPLLLALFAALWLWRREVRRGRKSIAAATGSVVAYHDGDAAVAAQAVQQQQQQQQQQFGHGHGHGHHVYQEVGTDGERAELPPSTAVDGSK